MEENYRKPLYTDYKKQRTHIYFWKDPVYSLERSYTLADKPLVVAGGILIVLAAFIMYSYIPWQGTPVYRGMFYIIMLCALLTGGALYSRKFLYRFGRFHVEWEHPLEHSDKNPSDNCERYGDFLKTEENSAAARKSRRAFLVFYTAVIAVVFLFCFFGYGLAYTRIYNWHRGEIEQAAQIAQRYESLHVLYWNGDISAEGFTSDGSGLDKEDEDALKRIFGSLQWDYIFQMGSGRAYGENPGERFTIELCGGYGYSDLVRYQDIVDISQVKMDYPGEAVTQMDEHWWYVR